MPTHIALLRGINVGGRNRIPMAELVALAVGLGWASARHYIQSGNLIFSAAGRPAGLEAQLEQAIADRFGLSIPVIVRSGREWNGMVRANPFAQASAEKPNFVMLGLAKQPLRESAASALAARATDGEQVCRSEGALWIHFPQGAGRSKLTPALLDRLAGSPVTLRNWNTVCRLTEMMGSG